MRNVERGRAALKLNMYLPALGTLPAAVTRERDDASMAGGARTSLVDGQTWILARRLALHHSLGPSSSARAYLTVPYHYYLKVPRVALLCWPGEL